MEKMKVRALANQVARELRQKQTESETIFLGTSEKKTYKQEQGCVLLLMFTD